MKTKRSNLRHCYYAVNSVDGLKPRKKHPKEDLGHFNKALTILLMVLTAGLLTACCFAQNKSYLELRGKIWTEVSTLENPEIIIKKVSEKYQAPKLRAEQDTVQISEMYGSRFNKKLKLGHRYIVEISATGFQTKVLELNTVNALTGGRYAFKFDITLLQDDYQTVIPVAYIYYNRKTDYFDYCMLE